MEEAKEKVQEEIGAPIDNELVDWSNWSDALIDQLVENIEKKEYTPTYKTTYYNYPANSWSDYEYERFGSSTTPATQKDIRDFYDEANDTYHQFNAVEYPTRESVINTWGLDERLKLRLDPDTKLWQVFHQGNQ